MSIDRACVWRGHQRCVERTLASRIVTARRRIRRLRETGGKPETIERWRAKIERYAALLANIERDDWAPKAGDDWTARAVED